jgi:hypothetical protein
MLANKYPAKATPIPDHVYEIARKKKLRLYVEYPDHVPGLEIGQEPVRMQLERAVVTSEFFGDRLKPMSIIGMNYCFVLPAKAPSSLITLAKVAGFDRAEYGTGGVPNNPALVFHDGILVAATKLSNFATGRYGPAESTKALWSAILGWCSGGKSVELPRLVSFVSPAYKQDGKLPEDARRQGIAMGVEWFYNGRFFVHPSWKALWEKNQGDGTNPFGDAVPQDYPNGDGRLGILEGHASRVDHEGNQEYRYWIRNDVQGEVSMTLAAAADYLSKPEYAAASKNLADFIFGSIIRGGPRNVPSDPNFGLMGWALTHPWVYYQDDNARSLLGLIGASAFMGSGEWDRKIAEGILANFRTAGKNGFRGERIHEQDLSKKGLAYFQNLEIVNPHPHFESWIWACYLWLYDKTKYRPLLDKTRTAIRLTMEAYPDKWSWTNGIQQERARMILPLAWLVRVEDTEEHRRWLDQVAATLLENQAPCGAIREELGAGSGRFGRTDSNEEYGLYEAPLISRNGDPVADMLYTCNFAFFSLHEAAKATGNEEYRRAVLKLSDFLTRIQVRSSRHKDLEGAWFRAFDYGRWDYWASNADAGWGAWGTLTGWIQSWIVTTQILVDLDTSFWDKTSGSSIGSEAGKAINLMLGKN